jgi:hypothetical protein
VKLIFVGPTLPRAADLVAGDTEVRPPAIHGDILNAVDQGVTVIGLIDGCYEHVAPVRHKEILFALSRGIRVFGGASMGALRAAECEAFGMVGVGAIFRQYASGQLLDDADVAQLHAPAELGYFSLTEPMVNVTATLAHLSATQRIEPAEFAALSESAQNLFFKERTYRSIVENANLPPWSSRQALEIRLRSAAVDQKRIDALKVLQRVAEASDSLRPPPLGWCFTSTTVLRKAI